MNFKAGIRDGIPIALGYFSVSIAFGLMAAEAGCTWFEAMLISITNLTSAGQFAGITVLANMGTYLEMALTQLVINSRYALMGISLSQKVDSKFKGIWRALLGYAITDEIFAVAIAVTISAALYYIPVFNGISAGFGIIICAVIASAAAAVMFPVKEGE